MIPIVERRKRRSNPILLPALVAVLAVLAVLGAASGEPSLLAAASSYLFLMTSAGAGLYLLTAHKLEGSALVLFSLLAGPAVSASVGGMAMAAGLSAFEATSVTIAVCASALVAAGWARGRRAEGAKMIHADVSAREWLALILTALVLCTAAAYLPLSSQYWRLRSDGWFHAAVVAEIETFGVPPTDPYFAGLPLQYMWIYHVLVLQLAKGTGLDPAMVMPVLNVHALVALILAVYTTSRRLQGDPWKAAFSVLVVVLSLNAVFWLFLPVKLARAFFGEVRGMAEVARILSLSSLDIHRVRSFLNIFYNESYFLDKFTVSTAFSLGLAFMAGFWRGTVLFLVGRSGSELALALACMLGMLTLHTMVGFVMLAGVAGGLVLLHLVRKSTRDYSLRTSSVLLAGCLLILLATYPYLRSVTSLKETEQLLPLGFSFRKLAGLLISCALALFLFIFQIAPLWSRQEAAGRFLLLTAASIALLSLITVLPGPNNYNKPPFFVNYPLALLGGWTLASPPWAGGKRWAAVLSAAVLLLPANAIALYGYARTTPLALLSPAEASLGSWVAANTPRDAVFIDSDDRVFLLVVGPRRYYWGTQAYAEMWGYRQELMEQRRHVRDNIFGEEALDARTLATLASLPWQVYVIGRGQPGLEKKISRHPQLFQEVRKLQGLTLYRIDQATCRSLVRGRHVQGER